MIENVHLVPRCKRIYPRRRIEKTLTKGEARSPVIEERERETKDEDIVKGVVYQILHIPTLKPKGGGEPLREGPYVRPEEGVEGVAEAVMGAEPPLRHRHQAQSRSQRVHHVRAGSRHLNPTRWRSSQN
uniref:Uncharacterized protein n=1 Tax=Opuntia streptacantha TaxID=393608 RepID=A0A7C9AXG0_OPUST